MFWFFIWWKQCKTKHEENSSYAAKWKPVYLFVLVTCIVWQAWLPLLVRMAETACRILPVSPQDTTRLKRQAQDRAVMACPVGSFGPVLRTVVSNKSWNRDSEGTYNTRASQTKIQSQIVLLFNILHNRNYGVNTKCVRIGAILNQSHGLPDNLCEHCRPYPTHQEAPSESPQAVVPAACPTGPAGCAGTARGERTASPLSAQIPHIGRCRWSVHAHTRTQTKRSISPWGPKQKVIPQAKNVLIRTLD